MAEFKSSWQVARVINGQRQTMRRVRHPKLGDHFHWQDGGFGHKFKSEAEAQKIADDHDGIVEPLRTMRISL